jgi:hypothetical protein
MSTPTNIIQKVTPRHREMMIRFINGQKARTIAEDMGITEGRLSIIKNSPLFQLELRRMMSKREEKLFDIQENFLDAADLGVKFHKEVLEQPTDPINKKDKVHSATLMTALASRLLRPGVPSNGNGDGEEEGQSYEERLRKVTVEERVRTVTPTPSHTQDDSVDIDELLEGDYPPTLELETGVEEDVLFGEMETDEDIFNPPIKIEDTLTSAMGDSH